MEDISLLRSFGEGQVSAAVVETLDSLQLEFPVMDKPKKAELEKVWKLLVKEER